MLSKFKYLICGIGIGGLGHYTYKKFQPQKKIQHSKRQMIQAYTTNKQIQIGYLIKVLKAVGFFLKGYYHYGLGNKLQGFNYHQTYLKTLQVKDDAQQMKHIYCIFSPTENICGHPQIQHGGATASIIDQNFGELAILNSKEMVATAEISIKYKKPIRKGQFYVLEGEVIKKEGRKIFIEGMIRDLQTGEVKVQAEALFIIVNWNNQMTKILTKFFRVINYKDYAHQQHTKLQYQKQKKSSQHHSVKLHIQPQNSKQQTNK